MIKLAGIKKISLIGAGNVATHLGIELFNAGIRINGVYSRKIENSKELAHELQTFGVDSLEELPGDSDLYIIAVTDSAIEILAHELSRIFGYNLKVVHTSGFISSDIFTDHFNNYGVFYFLQTFTKNRAISFDEIPCFITSDNPVLENNLYLLASKITHKIEYISDENRKLYHLAAVFSNNFTNHMYSISKDILKSGNLKIEFLYPLISETAKKITDGNDPLKVQTGPAIRHDMITIGEHLKLLERFSEYWDIYQIITNIIINRK